MKKLSVLFAVLLMAFGFSSCEYHNEYPTTYKNTTINLDLHVNSADWQWSEQGGYYYYTFSVPEMTNTIYKRELLSFIVSTTKEQAMLTRLVCRVYSL